MVSSRLRLVSTVLAFLVSASTALSIPSPLSISHPLELINTTISSLQAPPPHDQSLTFRPWPPRPYLVTVHGRSASPDVITLSVTPFHGTRSVSVPGLRNFLREFGENIERDHPIPGNVPRRAKQSFPDIGSYTRWTIELAEGLMGRKMPTEWALLALDEIGGQLGDYGPASVLFSIELAKTTYMVGNLAITKFGGPSLNPFLANETGVFQTS